MILLKKSYWGAKKMNKLTAIDAEYIIKPDDKQDSLIIGVVSRQLNASCWLRINDEYLSKATCKSLLTDLQAMESSMVYQKGRGLV